MPIDRYFDKFPKIQYSNSQIIDITKRVVVLDSVGKNPYIYYPYEISHNERADQLSSRYYDDPYKSWMIYLTNKIVDPYYEWYMHEKDFQQFIQDKYGSFVNAVEKIIHYRNNWEESENISISRFDTLTASQKKYWQPVYINNKINSYSRKQINLTINTNKIVSYTVSNNSFTNNEICQIVFNPINKGTGQILSVYNNKIYVQHTSGTTLANSTVLITSNSYIYGNESGVNTSFTTSNTIVENISDEEEIYYKAITYYEYETEKNEFNKTLRVIDNRTTQNVVNRFKELMRE